MILSHTQLLFTTRTTIVLIIIKIIIIILMKTQHQVKRLKSFKAQQDYDVQIHFTSNKTVFKKLTSGTEATLVRRVQ